VLNAVVYVYRSSVTSSSSFLSSMLAAMIEVTLPSLRKGRASGHRHRGSHLCKMWLSRWLIQTTSGRVSPTTPFPDPERARTEMREGTRKLRVRTERQGMHIDRPHEFTVAREPAGAARPSSSSGLVFVPTSGTPAASSSFGAGRARDAGLRRFVWQGNFDA